MASLTNEIGCPACSMPGTGVHCSYCGEIMRPQRITFKGILKSIPDILFDLDHGLLYTIPALIKKPGETVRRFFEGDRGRHYKPLKFLLFIVAVSAYLFIRFNIDGNNQGLYESLMTDKAAGKRIDSYSLQVDQLVLLTELPLLSLISWLFFIKKNYSYGEHLMAMAFFIGEVTLYRIILFPLFIMLNHTSGVDTLNSIYTFWILGYFTYAFYDWMYPKKTAGGFFLSLLTIIVIFIVMAIVSIILVPLFVYLKLSFFN